MYPTTCYADWDEAVSYLSHDNPPVSTSCNCSTDGFEFSFPIRPYLIYSEYGHHEPKGKLQISQRTCRNNFGTIGAKAFLSSFVGRGSGRLGRSLRVRPEWVLYEEAINVTRHERYLNEQTYRAFTPKACPPGRRSIYNSKIVLDTIWAGSRLGN